MTNSHLGVVAPITENRTVTLRRPKNGELRTRQHLTPDELERLIESAKLPARSSRCADGASGLQARPASGGSDRLQNGDPERSSSQGGHS
jgi:hypothetical protein